MKLFVLTFLQERGFAVSVPMPPSQMWNGSHFPVVPKSKVQDGASPKGFEYYDDVKYKDRAEVISPITPLKQIIFISFFCIYFLYSIIN